MHPEDDMSQTLFRCPKCSVILALEHELIDQTVQCPNCQASIVAPSADISFVCPNCQCDLCAPRELGGSLADCPNCEKNLSIPVPTSEPENRNPPQTPIANKKEGLKLQRSSGQPSTPSPMPEGLKNARYCISPSFAIRGLKRLF